MKSNIRTAKDIAFIGLASASLTAVKLALSWLANVELVTLFIIFYTLTLGVKRTIFACNIFIVCECLIYGIGPWVISYFIHWNTLCIVAHALNKKGVKKSIFYALWAILLTFLFGVQTSAIEVIIFSSQSEFLSAFLLKYFMGITFFAVHMASAFLSTLLLLPPLLKIKFSNIENN